MVEIIPAWMIEELEKLRREQENKRERLQIEVGHIQEIIKQPDAAEEESSIMIKFI